MVEHGQPNLRVLVPCSKWKQPSSVLASRDDLDFRRAEVEQALGASAVPAREMYVGRAYLRALAAVDSLVGTQTAIAVALHIASAGYGIVAADERIVPYEATMGSSRTQWAARGSYLQMAERLTRMVEAADVTIAALSQPYYVGCGIERLSPKQGLLIAIGTGQAPASPRIRQVHAGRQQARTLATTEREVASVVLSRLLGWIATDGMGALVDLPSDPLAWPSR